VTPSARVAARYKSKKKLDTGTVVYQYSERQIARRNNEKAARLEKLRGKIKGLRSQVRKDLKSSDPDTALTSLAVALIDHTYERVGNATSADDGHVGVTGWQKSHISFGRSKATIKYVGKSGVKQKKIVSDKAILAALRDAYEGCDEDSIFCHGSGKITASHVNAYLKKFEITAKDLRGFHANKLMQDELRAIRSKSGELSEDKKKRDAQLKKEFEHALDETAKAVGHEASTLKSMYLVPGLEETFLKDGSVYSKMKLAELVMRFAGLTTSDKRVVAAFIKKETADGRMLSTDGHSLYKSGLGSEKVAVWRGNKIAIVSTESSKSDEVILRYLVKAGGKNLITWAYDRQGFEKSLYFETGNDSIARGQHDGWISVWVPGRDERVGWLSWSLYQGRYQIKMVQVEPEFRRSGIATALYRKLFQDENITKNDLDPAWQTDEGSALRRSPLSATQRVVARYLNAKKTSSQMSASRLPRGFGPIRGN
jgi:ribosomal protein S18 acetylase RimI-like enzyme